MSSVINRHIEIRMYKIQKYRIIIEANLQHAHNYRLGKVLSGQIQKVKCREVRAVNLIRTGWLHTTILDYGV